jgi:hypothetical protein
MLDGFLDNDDDGVEAGLVGIVNRVIQDGLSAAANGINLLQTALTAAHASGHNYQNRFLSH